IVLKDLDDEKCDAEIKYESWTSGPSAEDEKTVGYTLHTRKLDTSCFVEPSLFLRHQYSRESSDPSNNWIFLDSSLSSSSSRFSYICDSSGPLFHSVEFWSKSRKYRCLNRDGTVDSECVLDKESFFTQFGHAIDK